MRTVRLSRETFATNPLDMIERLVNANDWIFDRHSEKEMAVQVPGRWCDYSLYFAWNDDAPAMHFTCALDMRVPAGIRPSVHELLTLINEKMWLGHFGLWDDEGLPMFRHVLPLRGAHGPSIEQVEDLMDTAILECERFYPAFQYVVWGGKSAPNAVAAALVDTVGEA